MSIKLTPPDDPFEHLHPEIRHWALADRAKRKELIQRDQWVSYPAGDSAIERLFELADMPPRMRMPSILFWAKPNMGKMSRQAGRPTSGKAGPIRWRPCATSMGSH